MMKKKKKQSRSQSSTKKILEPSSDSSPSPRLLSTIRSKLASGKDLKHMFRGRSKTLPGLSSQSRIVRCPKCHKLLQEPLYATSYKCGGCDSILQAKRWELEGNDNTNTIPEALLSTQNQSLSTEVKSAEGGSRTPVRSIQWEYNSRASPSVERGYHSETVYKHETSDINREWMRRIDEFSMTSDSDAFASARSSPYNSRSNTSQWKEHEGRYEDQPRVSLYPASLSPSSAYEYGYTSPFHGSHVSASEQSYFYQQPKQYGREGWFQESSVASPTHFPGETTDGKYYPRSSQSQLHDLQYHNLYESSSSATPHHSVYSERSYQAAAASHRSTYSEHSLKNSKSDTRSEKSSLRDKRRYVRERIPVVNHHIFPSAGGAPFATCSYCLELLQLPQVSPQGKHKRYQVRCGSCSGILKFSIREKADIVLHSPCFLDSGMGFADETVTNHQNSASEVHEDNYLDGSQLSCLEDDFEDTICKSIDNVILSRSLETFEDKGIKEDINISSIFLDSRLEALRPHLKPLVNWKQQPASSDTIAETSRIHLEQSQEAHSEKSTKIDRNISERVGCNLGESEYEKNKVIKPEVVVREGSGESLEVPVYKNERMGESREEAERAAEKPISHSGKLLYKNEYICERRVPSENTKETYEFKWEETREYGYESTWKEIMGDKPRKHIEKSQYIGDSIYDSSLCYGETFEDTSVNLDAEHTSNTYSYAMSATPQLPLKSLVNKNQRVIGHPDQSVEAVVTTSRIDEKQSKQEYENLRERQELETTICDRVRCELEESRYETNETLEQSKVGKGGSIVSIEKATRAGEERLVSHQMDSPNENLKKIYGTLDLDNLEDIGFASERMWEEIMEDRAGLHLEEYESNYGNCSRPFCMHDYELGTIIEPDEDPDGRSESSSKSSFNEGGGSEERVIFHDSQDAITEYSQYEYESSSERQELSKAVSDIVRSDLQELRYETNETLEPSKMVGDGSVVSDEKAGVTIISETGDQSSVFHQMEPENENMESYRTVEPFYLERNRCESKNPWAEYELRTVSEPEEDGDGRSIPSSRDSFNDHESLKGIAVSPEEKPWLVDENKTKALKVGDMVEDGPLLHLGKFENKSMKMEETLEWTSERAPTFCLHESELCTVLELDDDADGRSYYRSRSSFNNNEISKERELFNMKKPQLVIDGRTEPLEVSKNEKYTVPLDLEECGNESRKLDDTIEWTSWRTLTFRRCEVEIKHEQDADERSECSSRGFFNDTESSKERAVIHEDGPLLVDDYDTKVGKVSVMAENEPYLNLGKCKNEKIELHETLDPRDDIFRFSLELERMNLMSQDKQENPGKTFKQGDTDKDIPAFSSRVSPDDHKSPRKMAELDSESEEEILGDHLEHLQKENEKSGLTSEPYAHIYSTTEPSEIVGLRLALYQTQNSPLRLPLTSPIHTPTGSPLHYLMASKIRSPIASAMHSHIVSPLRSPINSSGSLSDVLFLSEKD